LVFEKTAFIIGMLGLGLADGVEFDLGDGVEVARGVAEFDPQIRGDIEAEAEGFGVGEAVGSAAKDCGIITAASESADKPIKSSRPLDCICPTNTFFTGLS
jgi:hypothetical protein